MDMPGSSLDFDSGASFSGMSTGSGSGSNPSQNSQQTDMSQGRTSHNVGMTASTSNTTITDGFIDDHPASALALDPTFGPDVSNSYQGEPAYALFLTHPSVN
jgi:hypothetical protein